MGRISLARQPLLPKERERVWSNVCRARVPAHCIVRANQIQVSLSHDNRSMQKYVRSQYVVNAMDVEAALKVAAARLGVAELRDKQREAI